MSQWHKFDKNNPIGLKDRFYYLVIHKSYKTPMRAKWYDDVGGYWQVFWTYNDSNGLHNGNDYWFCWDKDNPIIAWMNMPEIYKEEIE